MRTFQLILGTAAATLLAASGTSHVSAQDQELPSELTAELGDQLDASFSSDGPFETDLPDHLWIGVDENSGVFLHLDKAAPEATRVLYTGFAVRGRWCAEDQARIEELAGEGFTHFHRIAAVATAEAGHGGGEPGEPGYWLKHVAVGPAFEMPWGTVEPGQTEAGGWLAGDTILPEILRREKPRLYERLKLVDASIAAGDLDLSPLHGLVVELLNEQLATAAPKT